MNAYKSKFSALLCDYISHRRELDGHVCLCYKMVACWFSKRREGALYSLSERAQASKPLCIVNIEHLVFQSQNVFKKVWQAE